MGQGGWGPDEPESDRSWLSDTLRQFNFVHALRERGQVRRVAVEVLKLYGDVEAELPAASAQERYSLVIARRTGAAPHEVRAILRSVEDSFATWPVERDVTFRDVVQYLAITECLKTDPSVSGIQARVDAIVAEIVPDTL